MLVHTVPLRTITLISVTNQGQRSCPRLEAYFQFEYSAIVSNRVRNFGHLIKVPVSTLKV